MNAGPQAPQREATILLVDDEASVRRMLRTALSRGSVGDSTRYVVLEAGDGIEAQAALARGGIDIVVTDLAMPRMGGLDLLQWAQTGHPGLTWIILSGLGTLDDAIRAIRLGAFAFVTKTPQMIDSLLITVRNAVHGRWLEAERGRFEDELAARNEQLAEQVVQLTHQAELIESDLVRAEYIQRALLPANPPRSGHFAVDAVYRPSQNVGGDLYDVIPLGDRQLGLYVADATGHGVAAAMLAVLFKTKLTLTRHGVPLSPAEVLRRANDRLFEELFNAHQAPGMFLTAAYAVVNLDTNEVTVASAGHPPLLHQRGLGAARLILRTGPALGLVASAQYSQEQFVLERGDRLLLYTDGLCQGADERASIISHAAQVLADGRLSGQAVVRRLVAEAGGDDARHRLADDVTVLLLANTDQPSTFDNGTPRELGAPPATPPPRRELAQILLGSCDGHAVVSLAGAGHWPRARTFHEACMRGLRSEQALLIDLSSCPQLDSTLLGTLQEVVSFGIAEGQTVRLQGLRPQVRLEVEELGMSSVLERISAEAEPLPANLAPAAVIEGDEEADRSRLIRAHEALARLNQPNRDQFLGVIEGLRGEAPSSSRGRMA